MNAKQKIKWELIQVTVSNYNNSTLQKMKRNRQSMFFVFHLDKTFLMKEILTEYTKLLLLLLYKVSTWNKSEGPEAPVKTPVSPFPVLIA